MKKFWKYFTLTILFLLGLGCVGVLYLFFIPTSTLFGIAYITHNETIESDKFALDNINEISIVSRSYNVNILETEDSYTYTKIYSHAFGFVSVKNENIIVTSTYNESEKTLTFEVSEPYGAILKANSQIDLYIPSTKIVDLSISNKNAKTSINLPENGVQTLSYSTKNGKAFLNSGKVNSLIDLSLNKGTFIIDNKVNVESTDINLSISTGKFDSSANIHNLNIKHNERGVILLNKCNNINHNEKSSGGRIEAKEASLVIINSSETNVYIKTITNGATIILSGSANVNISELNGSSSHIESSSGKINIDKINSDATLATKNGSINVNKATLKITLDIEGSGSAKINFDEKAESNATNSMSRAIIAIIKSGKLSCTGVENVMISSSENSSINLNMTAVSGYNLIENKNGSTHIVVNKLAVYKLTTNPNPETPTVGDVRVNLSQISEHNGYTDKNAKTTWVNCETNKNNGNVMEVSSITGNITILDTNFA